jgi:hypothetical protein
MPGRDHHRAGGHVHFAGPLDNPLQRGPDVSLALGKQPQCVRVPVDTGAVCQAVFGGNDDRAAPRNEIRLNLFTLSVGADGAIALVPAHIHGFAFWIHTSDSKALAVLTARGSS